MSKMKPYKKCDVLITSSSRPELLEKTLYYWNKFAHFQGQFRFILHEDFLFPKESEKVIDICREKNIDFHFHEKPIGLIEVMKYMIPKINTPYMVMLQDDWTLERPLEVDRMLYTMHNYDHVNCIIINKYQNMPVCNSKPQPEEWFPKARSNMLRFHSWSFIPSIWRTSFVKEHMPPAMDKEWYEGRGDPVKTAPARMTSYIKWKFDESEWKDGIHRGTQVELRHKIGTYIWGNHRDFRYVRHIGEDMRAETHNRPPDIDGKPQWGKEHASQETAAKKFMAHWLDFEKI